MHQVEKLQLYSTVERGREKIEWTELGIIAGTELVIIAGTELVIIAGTELGIIAG